MIDTTRRHIEKHGWSVLGISPRAGEQGETFSYTIGLLDTFEHPEVLLSGIPAQPAVRLLNRIGELIREGRRFAPGDICGEIADEVPVAFTPLPVDYYYDELGSLQRWRGSFTFPALQCVWPDRAGAFPWAGGETPGQAVREDWWWGVGASSSDEPLWESARWAAATSLCATFRLLDLDPQAYLAAAADRRGAQPAALFTAAVERATSAAAGKSALDQFAAAHEVLPSVVDALRAGPPEPTLAHLLARHFEMRDAGTL